jgi:hypothetical protein
MHSAEHTQTGPQLRSGPFALIAAHFADGVPFIVARPLAHLPRLTVAHRRVRQGEPLFGPGS